MSANMRPDGGLPDYTDPILPLNAVSDQSTRALHELRTAAFRIAADCERMLEDLREHDHGVWRPVVADAYIAARELVSITSHATRDPGDKHETVGALGLRLAGPLRRVLDASARILRMVPAGVADELLLGDARALRDRAAALLNFDPRGEPPTAGPIRDAPRALVIEDERLLGELLRRHLVRLGFDVVLTENGHDGLAATQRDRPDIILSDIVMPHMDGMDFLRAVKSSDATRDIPVVMISGQHDVESVAQCIELGAEDHISKPFDPTLLNARISACLQRKKARDHERSYLRRVEALTSAAEAVERDAYVAGSLLAAGAADDELGTLARVFDRVVTGLKSREARLQRRLEKLGHEVGSDTGESAEVSVSQESPFASGETLAGRYEIIGKLGDGGMGMVYHAKDLDLGDEVAVKVVRKDLIAENPTIVERLKSEIRLARRISHRNVVRLHDLGEWNGTYFISMEFVRGVTVETLLDRRGRLSIESAIAIGSQLAEALAVAHDAQVIHRDIKPANLLVDEAGTLKVMDFGIARSVERDAKNLTASGFIVGTPQYMAPEQLCGRSVDARTDLFSLGVVLYECLTGSLPFSGDSPTALNQRIESCTFVALRERRPELPEALEALVHQQLQPRPDNRARSARELAERLNDLEHAASAQ